MKLKKIVPHIFLAMGVTLMFILMSGCVTTSQLGETKKASSVRFKVIGAIDTTLEWTIAELMQAEKKGIKHIRLDISTGGGSVLGMWRLIDILESLKAKGVVIHTHASGIVASAGIPIYLAGTYRTMSPTCFWMVHPHSASEVVCNDIDPSFCEMYAAWTRNYARYVAERTNFTVEEMIKLMTGNSQKDCHFFDANAAIKWGVAHRITHG